MNADHSGLNVISYAVIGAAHKVSNALGVGFSEKIYENALCHELRKQQVLIDQQRCYHVSYDGHVVGQYIPDLVISDRVIVEVKALDSLGRTERAQCINYLRATGLRLCLLLNFGRPRLEYARFILTR